MKEKKKLIKLLSVYFEINIQMLNIFSITKIIKSRNEFHTILTQIPKKEIKIIETFFFIQNCKIHYN